MEKVCIKVDIPLEFKEKFEEALAKIAEKLVRSIEFSIADELLKNSRLSEEDCIRLAEELRERVAKRHGL